jgi:FtsH-binding integral membrane protein
LHETEKPESMAGMTNPINRDRLQWPVTILILLEGLVLSLLGLHVISTGWAVAAFFVVIIPFATLKAFADFRQH